tara:strand:- start:930 stop:1775 length:846 start_codon:yes stop_codon:yes gene_type:complete
MSDWFRRDSKNIKTFNKRDTKEGMWYSCPKCRVVIYKTVLQNNHFVCHECLFHFRITSDDYIKIIIDDNEFEEFGANIISSDPLDFKIPKEYKTQIRENIKKTNKNSAVTTLVGKINNIKVVLGVMDFSFIGGSMGSVVGEKISQAIVKAEEEKLPLIIVTSSGGARMQEGAYSLMQLAKTSSKLARFSKNGGFYIVLIADPTTGGISASIAMLGDVILAEPNALICFAGPRVIKQTIGQDLPEGFQKSEFLLKKGFIDDIVHRKDLKNKLTLLIKLFLKK